MDQALNQKIDAYIAENKEQLLQDIAALVAIDSVEGTPEEGAPVGAGPRAALDKTLELAAGMGLATRNCENYIGYAELAGKGLTVALLLFVGIPLPGTGAWTGTLAASILDMKFKDVLIACMGGVLLAGIIMGLASAGLLGALSGLFAAG